MKLNEFSHTYTYMLPPYANFPLVSLSLLLPFKILKSLASVSTLIRNGPWCSYHSLKQTIKFTQFQLASFSSVLFAVVSILLGLLSLEVSSVCSASCPAFFDEGATLPFWRISVASCSSTSDGVKGSK